MNSKFYLILIPSNYKHTQSINVILFFAQIHHYWRFWYNLSYTGVGKSCLLLQYTDQRYRDKHEVTIGV